MLYSRGTACLPFLQRLMQPVRLNWCHCAKVLCVKVRTRINNAALVLTFVSAQKSPLKVLHTHTHTHTRTRAQTGWCEFVQGDRGPCTHPSCAVQCWGAQDLKSIFNWAKRACRIIGALYKARRGDADSFHYHFIFLSLIVLQLVLHLHPNWRVTHCVTAQLDLILQLF